MKFILYSRSYTTNGYQSSRQTQADVHQGEYDWSQAAGELNDLPFGEYFQNQHEKTFCLEDGQSDRDTVSKSHFPSAVAGYPCILLKYHVVFPAAPVARHSTILPNYSTRFAPCCLVRLAWKYLLESLVYVKMKKVHKIVCRSSYLYYRSKEYL